MVTEANVDEILNKIGSMRKRDNHGGEKESLMSRLRENQEIVMRREKAIKKNPRDVQKKRDETSL